MSHIDIINFTPREVHQSLLERLADFRRQVRGRLLLEGLARTLATAAGLLLCTFILDRAFRLSLAARASMDLAVLAAVIWISWKYLIASLRLKLEALTLVAAADQGGGNITAHVGTVLELPAMLASGPPALVHEAAARSHLAIADFEFDARLDNNRQAMFVTLLAAAVLIPLFLAVAAPASFNLWAARMFAGSNVPWPQRTYLQVAGLDNGVIIVPRGEPYVLRASSKPGSEVPQTIALRYRDSTGGKVEANLASFGANDFRYDIAAVNTPLTAELRGGDDIFGPFKLEPADRPRLVDLKLVSQHPTEKQPTTFTFNGDSADMSFLPRTRLHLEFAASTPVAEVHVKSSANSPGPADLKRIDDQHFSIDWTQQSAVQLQIDMVSKVAQLASVPTTVAIGLKTDQPPRVTISFTGVKARVTPHARIPLTIEARDDYGVAAAVLTVKIETPDGDKPGQLKTAYDSIGLYGPVKPTTETDIQPQYLLQLEDRKLAPGSLVSVNATAVDECYIGAQTSQSRQLVFRVVAPEELFREIILRQQAERARFRKQVEEAKGLRQELTVVATTEAATANARRHRSMQREVNRVNTTLAETLTEMRLNALGTAEAYELLQKNVLTPLQQLNDELLNPQKDALDNLHPQDTTALTEARDRQDQIVTRMDAILKQMSQWDSFVDVLNQLNEVIKLQGQAQQSTNQMKKQQLEGVFDK